MRAAILLIALLAACCAAQLSSSDIDTILSLHNNARANASPAPQTPLQPLVWDNTIAAATQTWVSQCKMNYSPKYYATLSGENIMIMKPTLNINSAFSAWASQQQAFSFVDGSCSSSSCMNFQQIMASSATSVGCGVATCSFGVFFVCNYNSFAQFTGKLPYTPTQGTVAPAPVSPTNPTPGAVGASGYATIDYRGTKAVLGVHDQKQCGSCWAFSTTAIIEGALGLKGLSMPLLSDQNVLDCSAGGSCDGGWTGTALKGMVTKAGIQSQAAYPYKAAQGTCAYNAALSQGKITKYGQTRGDFASMYNALVAYGPVGIAVTADDSWYSYSSGVISKDYTSVNHAVTVVGYDSTKDAWIVKNSWGPTWGQSGFVYISAQHPAGANIYGAFWAQ